MRWWRGRPSTNRARILEYAQAHSCIRGAAGIRGWLPTPLEKLHAELAAVRTQIERTDRLIDEVVYRLYGLTAEEIAVVERSV